MPTVPNPTPTMPPMVDPTAVIYARAVVGTGNARQEDLLGPLTDLLAQYENLSVRTSWLAARLAECEDEHR